MQGFKYLQAVPQHPLDNANVSLWELNDHPVDSLTRKQTGNIQWPHKTKPILVLSVIGFTISNGGSAAGIKADAPGLPGCSCLLHRLQA
jgi:hypothetical protein